MHRLIRRRLDRRPPPKPAEVRPELAAAQVTLPMLSGVADRLRWLAGQRGTEPHVRAELDATLSRIDELIHEVWTRALCGAADAGDPLEAPTDRTG